MMKTKEQYAQQCKDENPEMVETINGVERKLGKKEYDAAVEAWALMRWYQDNPDQQPAPTPLG
jgi:heterodisulfide reductase subunit B